MKPLKALGSDQWREEVQIVALAGPPRQDAPVDAAVVAHELSRDIKHDLNLLRVVFSSCRQGATSPERAKVKRRRTADLVQHHVGSLV
jgi:hypothetical protein